MAFTGRKVFTAGEVLTASNMNSLVDQSVMVFSSTAARTTAIPTPATGMFTFITATLQFQYWNGSAWTDAGGGGGGFDNFLLMGA